MKAERSIVIRYSEAFKHQVIKEVAEGHSSCAEAHKKYGIKGVNTVLSFYRPLSATHLLAAGISLFPVSLRDISSVI